MPAMASRSLIGAPLKTAICAAPLTIGTQVVVEISDGLPIV